MEYIWKKCNSNSWDLINLKHHAFVGAILFIFQVAPCELEAKALLGRLYFIFCNHHSLLDCQLLPK